MSNLDALLKPTWGAEKWILEGWNALNSDEKGVVTKRMDALFSKGLPFKLKHDRMVYIYAFSLLAQLEVLAIQVPLKFEATMPTLEFKQRMHTQLMDEVFHGMVFTRILYELITPYALPPAYNEEIETLCNFIREEDCPKVAVVLLNLVAEAWIEELFRAYDKADIASTVFSTILADEHRHVCEADLYREIGLPTLEILKSKLAVLEEQLLSNLLFNYPYMNAMMALLGMEGLEAFYDCLDKKHHSQLEKLKLSPGKPWCFWMEIKSFLFPQMKHQMVGNQEIELSAMRKVLMTQWKTPTDPTMVGEFEINVTRLGFWSDKNVSDKLTVLMLQALSQSFSDNPSFRRYLSYHKLYQSAEANVALVVKLPDCEDHLGAILFENCHELSMKSLAKKIIKSRQMMVYCYKKRLLLEQKYPYLAELMDETMHDIATGVYPYPISGNPAVSLSNIGPAGFSHATSPLRMNEAIKFTLLTVERKPVWNEASQAFLPEDILPVSLSADHRVFDGMTPIARSMKQTFNQMADRISVSQAGKKDNGINTRLMMDIIDDLIAEQPKVAYKLLIVFQTMWLDFVDFGDWVSNFKRTKSKAALA